MKIGFIGILTIVFIVLKLTDYIDWSWFWVLSPVIFAGVATIAIIIGMLLITLILEMRKNK